jgi:predicted small secreted protein
MKRRLFLLLLLVLICFPATAQNIIKGVVKDAKTGHTLSGANVYLSNTTIGAMTNNSGRYKLKTPATGVFRLIFSFIGYQTKVFKVELSSSHSSRILNVNLEPKTYEMKELKVNGSNKKWKQRFKRFRKAFIGETDFAQKVTIKNPYYLHFSVVHHKLTAKSPRPLSVINMALGYKITVRLVKFSFKNQSNGFYIIYPRFEKLTPKNPNQRKKWEHNRREIYKQSLKSFFKNLYNHTLYKTYFKIQNANNLIRLDQNVTEYKLLGKSGVSKKYAQKLKGFKLKRKTEVVYAKPVQRHNPFKAHYSVLNPATSKHTFFVDEKGNLLNALSLTISGYWAKSRLANTLPRNYTK